MWYTICSDVWQLMPSTGCPCAMPDVSASKLALLLGLLFGCWLTSTTVAVIASSTARPPTQKPSRRRFGFGRRRIGAGSGLLAVPALTAAFRRLFLLMPTVLLPAANSDQSLTAPGLYSGQ